MTKKSLGAKPFLLPQPALVLGTYNADGSANAMVAAWGGLSEETEISICVDDRHKTTENLVRSGSFTVGISDRKHVAEVDYLGVVSGKDAQGKVAKAGFTAVKSEFVDAPVFEELPLTLECKVKSYDKETCRLVGEIVNVLADEAVFTDGKVDVSKVEPLVYDPFNHGYYVVKERVADAFKVGKSLK